MVSPPRFLDLALSEIKSTLSTAPPTSFLDRVEQDISFRGDPIEIDSQATPTIADPSTLQPKILEVKSVKYIEVLLKSEGKRAQTAWYWEHGKEWECQKADPNGKKPRVWACAYCNGFKHYSIHGSSKINDHLSKVHKLRKDGPLNPRTSIAAQLQRHSPQTLQDLDITDSDRRLIQEKKFKAALVAFICCCHIAFSIVENRWFITLLSTMSNLVAELMPASHTTVRKWMIESFYTNKSKIRTRLHQARSNIHLSFDLWTSGNYYSFNAIIAHFVDTDYKIKTALIGFRDLEGPHSGENIAESVKSVCEEYGIISQIGCFVLDNAENNDTCVQALARTWGWSREEAKQRRLRCFGHIINLVAQAFALGEKQTEFENALKAEHQQLDQAGKQQLWQICGPIGKLHYIIVYILRTPQRRRAFKAGGEECDPTAFVPKRDNSTRWNSIYQMILRAIKLKAHIELYCFKNKRTPQERDGFLDEMLLNDDDWYVLRELGRVMKIFEDATEALQGHAKNAEFGSMGECIPIIEALQDSLIRLQREFPEAHTFNTTAIDGAVPLLDDAPIPGSNPATAFITNCTNNAFNKLAKYYGLTDASIWYTAGLVLNPAVKFKYLKHQWKDQPQWYEDTRAAVKRLWQLQYKPRDPHRSQGTKRAQPNRGYQPAKSVKREGNFRDSTLFAWKNEADSDDDADVPRYDEYEQYLQEEVLEFNDSNITESAIDYWKTVEPRWPNLTRFALDALSIPAMSAECERCFSSSGNMITDNRNSLNPESIEAGECQRHWLMRKLV
jgi:hypothetical protein